MDKLKRMLSPTHGQDETTSQGDTHASELSGHGNSSANTTGTHLSTSTGRETGLSSSTGTSNLDSQRPAASAIPSHLSSVAGDNASTSSIRSGVVGDSSAKHDPLSSGYASGTTGVGSRDLADRTVPSGLGGANTSQSGTERSFPLGGPTNTTGQSHLGRDAAIAGGAGAAGLGAYEAGKTHTSSTTGDIRGPSGSHVMNPLDSHEHKGHGHVYTGDPCPPGDEPAIKGYPHHVPGPHSTDTANRLDPHVPGEYPTESGVDLHSTRDNTRNFNQTTGVGSTTTGSSGAGPAIAAGTAGVAGATALGTHHHHERSAHEPHLAGVGGYEEQKYDPAAAHSHQSSQTGSIGYPSSTSVPSGTATGTEKHHLGRDAAIGTAAGAGAVGTYELAKDHHHSGPASTSNQQGSGLASSASTQQSGSHHYGRDAALAGGAGAAGLAGYEATKHDRLDPTQSGRQEPLPTPTGAPRDARIFDQTQRVPAERQTEAGWATDSRAQEKLEKERAREAETGSHHYGRDAALAGGAGAAGLAGYEATKNDRLDPTQGGRQEPLATPTGAPRDARVFDQTQRVPESRQADAGWAVDSKAQEKLEKERAKEAEKAHDRAVKDNEKHAKEVEKEQKHHAKEVEKAHDKAAKEEDTSEKKHGILGFLHRDKHDTPEEQNLKEQGNLREADQLAHARHQRELEAGAAAGTVGVAGASFEPSLRDQEENLNDPSSHRVSTDERGHNKLHKDPPPKVQRDLEQRSQETGTYGGSSTGATGNDGIVTEPHTGLPMNVGKYGSGHGGTDGSSNITGFHQT